MHLTVLQGLLRLLAITLFYFSLQACASLQQTVDSYIYQIPNVDFNDCFEAGLFDFDTVTTVSGTETIRYFIKTKPGAQGTLIHFHGNADSACYALGQTQAGFDPLDRLNLVYVEYPGYSGDSTTPSEPILLVNAEAVYTKIAAETSLPIVLSGHSIGANISTWVASLWPLDGIILISSFPYMKVLADLYFPGIELDLGLNLYSASDWAPAVTEPLLVIAPENDQVVPVILQQSLWSEFGSNVAEFQVIPGVDHNSVMLSAALYTEINDFLDSVL